MHSLELDQIKAIIILVTNSILLRKQGKILLLVHSQIEGAYECQR